MAVPVVPPPVAGMASPASVSPPAAPPASPSAAAAPDPPVDPPAGQLPGTTSPRLVVSPVCSASPVSATAADEASSDVDDESARVWDAIVANSVLPNLNSPSPSSLSSRSPASPAVSPATPAVASAALAESSSDSDATRILHEQISEALVELSSGDESEADAAVEDATASTSHVDGAGLFDDSDDNDDEVRMQRSRLRRGDEMSSWHPSLPSPPARHPSTNHINHCNPIAPWDYSKVADIVHLLDVYGEVPQRCYLVHWKGHPLRLSWVWMGQLDQPSLRYMMERVDLWKASGTSDTFTSWDGDHDTASKGGTCFMDVFRNALYYLGEPNLVTMATWDAFEVTRPADIQYGVSRDDVTEFFKHLQRQSVPLNYDQLLSNMLRKSSANVTTLCNLYKDLAPDAYLVSTGQDGTGHCFGLISHGPGKRLLILDDRDERQNPQMVVRLLSNQQWIRRVKWVCRVELQPGYQCRHGKRKSKMQRNRAKRFRQQMQQL